MLSAIIAVLFLFADQLIKFWTVSHIELNTGIRELFPGILHMTYIKNFGAAFGLFSNVPWLRWALLGLLVCFTLFILLGVRRGGYLRTGFARFTGLMLLAGLLGNGIDRAIYGYVVDMFELEIINFAIFNLADVLVVFFGILFCIALIAGGIGSPDEYEDDEEELSYVRHRSSREEPQRSGRSRSEGQARRTSGSSQQPHRASGSGSSQTARRTSGGSQAARRPSGSGQTTRRASGSDGAARRPRPTEAGMSVRPLVQTQAPAQTAAPETTAEATRPFQPVSAPAETTVKADTTRPFQPVSLPSEPKVESGATRPFQPVSLPDEPKAKSGDTQVYQPTAKPAAAPAASTGDTQTYQPAAKPAPKQADKPTSSSSDDFDLDSILAEFK